MQSDRPLRGGIYLRQGEVRGQLIGVTKQERILVVIYTVRESRVRVVTAYPASPRIQSYYRSVR